MSCERIVEVGEIRHSDILATFVEQVVEAPRGARPGSCFPDYSFDAKACAAYGKASRDASDFKAYLTEILN